MTGSPSRLGRCWRSRVTSTLRWLAWYIFWRCRLRGDSAPADRRRSSDGFAIQRCLIVHQWRPLLVPVGMSGHVQKQPRQRPRGGPARRRLPDRAAPRAARGVVGGRERSDVRVGDRCAVRGRGLLLGDSRTVQRPVVLDTHVNHRGLNADLAHVARRTTGHHLQRKRPRPPAVLQLNTTTERFVCGKPTTPGRRKTATQNLPADERPVSCTATVPPAGGW